jgi:hypothetical protein
MTTPNTGQVGKTLQWVTSGGGDFWASDSVFHYRILQNGKQAFSVMFGLKEGGTFRCLWPAIQLFDFQDAKSRCEFIAAAVREKDTMIKVLEEALKLADDALAGASDKGYARKRINAALTPTGQHRNNVKTTRTSNIRGRNHEHE